MMGHSECYQLQLKLVINGLFAYFKSPILITFWYFIILFYLKMMLIIFYSLSECNSIKQHYIKS